MEAGGRRETRRRERRLSNRMRANRIASDLRVAVAGIELCVRDAGHGRFARGWPDAYLCIFTRMQTPLGCTSSSDLIRGFAQTSMRRFRREGIALRRIRPRRLASLSPQRNEGRGPLFRPSARMRWPRKPRRRPTRRLRRQFGPQTLTKPSGILILGLALSQGTFFRVCDVSR